MTAAATAIVVAGGTGERFGRTGGKQLLEIAGRPVLARTLDAVLAARSVGDVVVVCPPERVAEYRVAVAIASVDEVRVTFVAGGATRQDSVAAGLAAVLAEAAILVVHDGARPLAPAALLDTAVAALAADKSLDGVVVGHPMSDTLKLASGALIAETPDRSRYWAVQTPQAFRADTLRRAYALAASDGFLGTDDSSLVERAGGKVALLQGPRDNLKITQPEDAIIAEAILDFRASEGA